MAEFRRLISYIYAYEGQVKGKNVGFVKLEARNGICRLNVNVKKLYMGSGDMGVYLLTGRQEIFLGNIFLRGGCGEFRTVVQVADVQESGETMDECYGLTLHEKNEAWRSYTTIWEDAVAQAAQVTLESVTSEETLEREVEKGGISTVIEEPKKPQDPGAGQEKETELQNAEEEMQKESPAALAQEAKEGTRENPPGRMMENRFMGGIPRTVLGRPMWGTNGQGQGGGVRQPAGFQSWQKDEQNLSEEEPPEGEKFPGQNPDDLQKEEGKEETDVPKGTVFAEKPDVVPEFEMGQLEWETRHPNVSIRQGTALTQAITSAMEEGGRQKQIPAGETEPKKARQPEDKARQTEIKAEKGEKVQPQPKQPVIRQHREEPLIIGDPEALAKLDAEDAMEGQVPVWDFFEKTYPKIQAFDSEYGCRILVIKPQDIGLLPRETWIYGNNSFLLHGYYNYRYLILARLENPNGAPRYLLGIPGHYYSNEKYMASMFGFPNFVLSKKQPTQDGRFGYWYTDIRMEDGAAAKDGAP